MVGVAALRDQRQRLGLRSRRHGFPAGRAEVIPVNAPPGTPGSYDSDELTNYELGLRADSPSGMFALDVTAYFLDWEDVQLLAMVNGSRAERERRHRREQGRGVRPDGADPSMA